MKTVSRKFRCWTVLLYCFFLVPCALAAQGAQPTSVTVAYTSVSPQYAPVWIAKEAGFFRRNGVNAQLVYMRGGVLATQALVSNDVNFISAGGGGVVDAVLGGADIFMIASPINQEPQVLLAKKEIKETRQLRGKRLAVNSLAGPAMLSLKMILLRPRSRTRRDLSSHRSVGKSLRRVASGAGGSGDPGAAVHLRRTQGGLHFFEDLPATKQAELPNAALATSRRFAEAEPLATEMVVKSVIEGIHFYTDREAEDRRDFETVHENGGWRGAGGDV